MKMAQDYYTLFETVNKALGSNNNKDYKKSKEYILEVIKKLRDFYKYIKLINELCEKT